MQVRNVVTAFLMRRTFISPFESMDEFLLLKRSSLVHTFKERWAGISGTIEKGESPFECVSREIHEETGLTVLHHKLPVENAATDTVNRGKLSLFALEDLSRFLFNRRQSSLYTHFCFF